MSPEIATLILEYKEQIFQYLLLRADFSLNNKLDVTIINQKDLDDLVISGFILKENGEYIIRKDDWVYLPPQPPTKKEKEQYIPKALVRLAETVGYPGDWGHQIKKYRARYFSMKKEFGDQELQETAEYVKEKYKEHNIQQLLTKTWYLGFRGEMKKSKEANKPKARPVHEEF